MKILWILSPFQYTFIILHRKLHLQKLSNRWPLCHLYTWIQGTNIWFCAVDQIPGQHKNRELLWTLTELRQNASNSRNALHYVFLVSAGTVVFGLWKKRYQTNEGSWSCPRLLFDFPKVHGGEGVITKLPAIMCNTFHPICKTISASDSSFYGGCSTYSSWKRHLLPAVWDTKTATT